MIRTDSDKTVHQYIKYLVLSPIGKIMFTCDLFINKSHVDIIMLHVDITKSHVDIIMLHVDINKSHVHIIMLHVDINKSHVDIIMLHV